MMYHDNRCKTTRTGSFIRLLQEMDKGFEAAVGDGITNVIFPSLAGCFVFEGMEKLLHRLVRAPHMPALGRDRGSTGEKLSVTAPVDRRRPVVVLAAETKGHPIPAPPPRAPASRGGTLVPPLAEDTLSS
jgi:hypothetical protein